MIVALESADTRRGELVDIVARAEAEVGGEAPPGAECAHMVGEPTDEWGEIAHHPCEGPGTRRSVAAFAADGVGLWLSLVNRIAPWAPLPREVAATAAAFQFHPKLRRWATESLPLHPDTARSAMPIVGALLQGVATGGEGLVLDVVQRAAAWREARAHRATWTDAEERLILGAEHAAAEAVVTERPRPVPHNATDRYAERALGFSSAAGLLAAPLAGVRRGAAVALTGVAKAPESGREGFATSLGRLLALRGVIVMDRGVLRRLGHVDTVVIDAAVLRGRRAELVDVAALSGARPEEVAERAFRMFDPEAVTETRSEDGWTLGPLDALDLRGRTGRQAAARLRKGHAEDVLGLAEGQRLQAVVGLARRMAPGAEAIAAAARRSGAKIVVAAHDPGDEAATVAGSGAAHGTVGGAGGAGSAGSAGGDVRPGIPPQKASAGAGNGSSRAHPSSPDDPPPAWADRVVPGGHRIVSSIRALQADGAVVLVVSGRRRALGAADCGVGVHDDGDPPPWGAHLLVGSDLVGAALLVDAVGAAARVDHDSVFLAAGGTGVGAVAALQAPPARAAARGAQAGTASAAMAFCLGAWRARQLSAQPADTPADGTPWHLMPVDAVMSRLRTSAEGLGAEDASARARAAGEQDTDTDPRPGLWSSFLDELANPLTPVLAAGAALAAAVGSGTDAALVGAITGTSALVGAVQRVRTDRALAELFARSAVGARVRRDGGESVVTAGDLVRGDVILLGPGDVVPADARLMEADGLEMDESSLTGESLPSPKDPAPVIAAQLADRRSMVYEGTTVAAGRAVAVVVATGAGTEIGRSLSTARHAPPRAGVEARLSSLTKNGIPIALGSAGAVVGAGLLHGRPLSTTLGAAVNLAVASVPEGLPFLVGAAQLAAARRLADEGALVRRPRTIEALGRVDVLCFDKTGTLTEGDLRLAVVSDGERSAPVEEIDDELRAVLGAAMRATPSARSSEKPAHHTDRAVIEGARRARATSKSGAGGWRRSDALPFEPSRAYHATTGRVPGGGRLLSVKGAPETVLERCSRRRTADGDAALDARARKQMTAAAEELAGAGRRVLAIAERTIKAGELDDDAVTDLTFVGFVGLSDPVRGGASDAVARLREAGVQIVMLTGDHPATADAISATISEDDEKQKLCTGAELDELDDDALDRLLPEVDVIARCSPRHKVRIIEAYQRLGRVVAMTGDGANDAPAIRLADVGIALGRRGTPAASAAADLIVGDDRLETIIAALVEGRAMWSSVRTALAILVGGNFGEIGFSVLAAALTGSSPLTARQILLVNLLTDLAPAVAIAMREPRADAIEHLLREGPDKSLGTALTHEMLLRAATTTLGAGLAWGAARLTGRRRRAGTVALAALVGTQLGQTLTTGSLDRNVLVAGVGSALLLAAVIQTPGVSNFFGCTPLGPVGWSIALSATTTATLANAALTPIIRRLATGADENGDAEADAPTE
ncbi:MAG TPA: cation-translocating P-type ATPase [Yinghuangia sp.]|nr:cation-translocating P-type ATPase [Yinghuangia sp.]